MRFPNQKLLLRVAIALVGTGLAGCSQHPVSPVETKAAVKAGEIGSSLPDFSMKDLKGREVSSGDLRGKVVIVDFWATWCQPCKKEMPGYQKLLDRYGSRGFAVVGFKATMMMDTEVQFASRRKMASTSAGRRVSQRHRQVRRHPWVADDSHL